MTEIANANHDHDENNNELPQSLLDAMEVLANKEAAGQGLPAAPTQGASWEDDDDNEICIMADMPLIFQARVHINRVTGEARFCEMPEWNEIGKALLDSMRANYQHLVSREAKSRIWKAVEARIEEQKQRDAQQQQQPAPGSGSEWAAQETDDQDHIRRIPVRPVPQSSSYQQQQPAGALDEETRLKLEALAGQVQTLTEALRLLTNAQNAAQPLVDRVAWLEGWVRAQEDARAMALAIAEEELEAKQVRKKAKGKKRGQNRR